MRLRNLWLTARTFLLWFTIALALVSCTTAPPQDPNNICNIFAEYPSWYWAARETRHKWGVPISVQMAIMHQESRFRADAKPPRTYLLWVIPWGRQTSAYGYSQAIDQTWQHYQRETGHTGASRTSFADASDFIGWYAYKAHRQVGVPRNNAYDLYLAYHEGLGGYQRRSYRRKQWLMDVARKVQSRANMYRSQLLRCEPRLAQRRSWWQFW